MSLIKQLIFYIILFWRILHYKFFQFSCMIYDKLIFHLEPLYRTEIVKRNYTRQGIHEDVEKNVRRRMTDPECGHAIYWAGIYSISMCFFYVYILISMISLLSGFLIVFEVLESSNPSIKYIFLFTLALLCFAVEHLILHRNNRYLKDFKEFQKWDASKNRFYSVVCILFVIAIFFLVIILTKFVFEAKSVKEHLSIGQP